MHQFKCGHQECGSQLTASTKAYLMSQVAEHLRDAHAVPEATQTLMAYLEAACVTTTSDSSANSSANSSAK